MIPGIDTSKWQFQVQAKPDFSVAISRGVKFVIARSSIGLEKDECYDIQQQAAQEASLTQGAYHWVKPHINQAKAEAEFFLQAAGDATFLMADIEENALTVPEWGGRRVADWFHEFLDALEAGHGKQPLIYTGAWWWDPRFGELGQEFAKYDFMVSGYPHQWPGGNASWPPVPLDANQWYEWATTTQAGDPGLPNGPRTPLGDDGWSGWQISSWALAADYGFVDPGAKDVRLDCNVVKPEAWERWIAQPVTLVKPCPQCGAQMVDEAAHAEWHDAMNDAVMRVLRIQEALDAMCEILHGR
jgi:GH25 family lysozyme M1 (1,4-beta-N-acetylmuramidase)